MPVSIVVGGQYGSEGKGKVSLHLARRPDVRFAVRVGGPNSGHTAFDRMGEPEVLRQLPTASLIDGPIAVLPAGCYIDVSVLLGEIKRVELPTERLIIDPHAVVVTATAQEEEHAKGLGAAIGSTETGTGAALLSRVARNGKAIFASAVPELEDWVRPTHDVLIEALERRERVLIEGTQGAGLSVYHSDEYPFVTSRDTTASATLSEAGLSPLDVDEVVLVLRAFPIRVAGNSGPMEAETSWSEITKRGGHDHDIQELTSVTGRVRRVATFSARVPRRAIQLNRPTSIVLNHLDYVDHQVCLARSRTHATQAFVRQVEASLGREVDLCGYGRNVLEPRTGGKRG
jgi:adenylosuccinate synthase